MHSGVQAFSDPAAVADPPPPRISLVTTIRMKKQPLSNQFNYKFIWFKHMII